MTGGEQAEISYWWQFTTQIWVVLLIVWRQHTPVAEHQIRSAIPGSGQWLVISIIISTFVSQTSCLRNPVVALRNLGCFLRQQAHSGCWTSERCKLTRTCVPISSKSSVTRTNIGPYIVLTVGIDVTNGTWGTALVNIYGLKRKTFKNSRQSSSVALSCPLACSSFLIQQVSGNGGSRSRAHTRFFFTRTNILVFFPNLVSVLKFWWIPLPRWHSNPVSL